MPLIIGNTIGSPSAVVSQQSCSGPASSGKIGMRRDVVAVVGRLGGILNQDRTALTQVFHMLPQLGSSRARLTVFP